jgi:kinesin family protein 4/21/27
MSSVDNQVRVAVRIRPLSEDEQANECGHVIRKVNESQILAEPDKYFAFDYVFAGSSNQEDVYDTCVSGLVDSFFEGFNATVLAYGQTGSGKVTLILALTLSLNLS